jgi:hypothetical protein
MHNIYYSVVFEKSPCVFLDPEARATMVTLFIQTSEHLLIYLQGVSQISQGHVLSNLKMILWNIDHTLCFLMLGPITRSPFESYYNVAESLTFSNSCLPFFIVCICVWHSKALSTILSIGSKLELGSKNTIV